MLGRKKGKQLFLKGLGINLLLSVSSVAIFLAGGELLARLQYTPQKYEHPGTFIYDKEKVFALRKNYRGTYKDSEYSTNSHGYRGNEISVEKPRNKKRILVVGDSVTFGHGMSDEQTYPYLLEQSLNEYYAEQGEETSVEVINTGVPGNSTYQEYYDLKRGLKFNPDLIVLQITLNDIIEPYAGWIFKDMGMEEGELETISHEYILGQNDLPYFDYFLRQHSAFYLFLKDMNARIRFMDLTGNNIAEKAANEEQYNMGLLVNEPDGPIVTEAWRNIFEWIRRMIKMAEERDIPLVLLATPYDFQFTLERELAFPQQKMREFASEEGIYYVDMLEALCYLLVEREGEEKTFNQIIAEWRSDSSSKLIQDFWEIFFIDFVHPSAIGNGLITNILQPVILNALNPSAEEGSF